MQGDDIYDAMLNQTNVGDNNNKFYVIQLLGYLSALFLCYHLSLLIMCRKHHIFGWIRHIGLALGEFVEGSGSVCTG